MSTSVVSSASSLSLPKRLPVKVPPSVMSEDFTTLTMVTVRSEINAVTTELNTKILELERSLRIRDREYEELYKYIHERALYEREVASRNNTPSCIIL